jgi:hypothetical protein
LTRLQKQQREWTKNGTSSSKIVRRVSSAFVEFVSTNVCARVCLVGVANSVVYVCLFVTSAEYSCACVSVCVRLTWTHTYTHSRDSSSLLRLDSRAKPTGDLTQPRRYFTGGWQTNIESELSKQKHLNSFPFYCTTVTTSNPTKKSERSSRRHRKEKG